RRISASVFPCVTRGFVRRPRPYRPGQPRRSQAASHLGRSELAGRRKEGLVLIDHLHNPRFAVFDLEDELAQKCLVVLLAQRLVALPELLPSLHLQPLQPPTQLYPSLPS